MEIDLGVPPLQTGRENTYTEKISGAFVHKIVKVTNLLYSLPLFMMVSNTY